MTLLCFKLQWKNQHFTVLQLLRVAIRAPQKHLSQQLVNVNCRLVTPDGLRDIVLHSFLFVTFNVNASMRSVVLQFCFVCDVIMLHFAAFIVHCRFLVFVDTMKAVG